MIPSVKSYIGYKLNVNSYMLLVINLDFLNLL